MHKPKDRTPIMNPDAWITSQEDPIEKQAYCAYAKDAGGVSLVSQTPLPPWEDLDDRIRHAWSAAATAVRKPIIDDYEKVVADLKDRITDIEDSYDAAHGRL